MEPLPDFATLSDEGLKELIEKLMHEEQEVSYRRRILHGQIDILRAERQARLQRKVQSGGNPLDEIDVEKLTNILAGKASPLAPEERE